VVVSTGSTTEEYQYLKIDFRVRIGLPQVAFTHNIRYNNKAQTTSGVNKEWTD